MRIPLLLVTVAFGAAALPLRAETILPKFDDAVFLPGAEIDNLYFPIKIGRTAIIEATGIDDEGESVSERSELTGLPGGRTILGVQTTTQLDRAYEDGLLVEETHDYYAQDTDGNVWYMGEDVVNFIYDDDGVLIDTNNESAWIAGEKGALPGYIMPALPEIGTSYFQEFAAADRALDEAMIYDFLDTLEVGSRSFSDVLVTFETTQLDPEAREFKYYAPGIGLIRVDEGLDEALQNPELVFELTSIAPVPLPGGLPMLGAALGGVVLLRRRYRR